MKWLVGNAKDYTTLSIIDEALFDLFTQFDKIFVTQHGYY